jgi:hypothetical protein
MQRLQLPIIDVEVEETLVEADEKLQCGCCGSPWHVVPVIWNFLLAVVGCIVSTDD